MTGVQTCALPIYSGLLAVLGCALLGLGWWEMRHFAWPTREAAIRRLERDSDVPHRPLVAVQDQMIAFRREIIARPGVFACDVAFLRGAQEEMWRKLLQLQFATSPGEVLDWMLGQGLGATLAAYKQDAREAKIACREGALALAKWTVQVRNAVHARPGHDELFVALRRAAHTAGGELLFVAAGIDPNRPLNQQGDVFWWGSGYYAGLAPYEGFRRVVRGFSRSKDAVDVESYGATIDGGAGFGGTLNAVCFDYDGKAVDWIQA